MELLPRLAIPTLFLLGPPGCGAEDASTLDSSAEAVALEAAEVGPPESVIQAALQVRSSLLMRQSPAQVERAASDLGWVQRAWFATESQACRDQLGTGTSDCLAHLDTLRRALLVEPEVEGEVLVDGTPGVVSRLFDHAQLSALREGVALELLRDELAAELVRGAEADPVKVDALLDAAGNGVIALQQQRIVELARGLHFLDDSELSAVVLGEAVSSWTWLPPAEATGLMGEGT